MFSNKDYDYNMYKATKELKLFRFCMQLLLYNVIDIVDVVLKYHCHSVHVSQCVYYSVVVLKSSLLDNKPSSFEEKYNI